MRVGRKDGTFYLVNYRALDLLRRVRFLGRYYYEWEDPRTKLRPSGEEIENM